MKISIITVTFNSEKFITHCLKSIYDQTYKNVEHIIVDGNSTDNTLNIIKRFKGATSKVISEPDSGVYDAMNKGILLCTGEIIGILNSDDFYADQNILTEIVRYFSETGSQACFGDLCYVEPEKPEIIRRFWTPGAYKTGCFANGWIPPHPTFFVRADVYKKFGMFDPNFKFAADVELMMRLLEVHEISVTYIQKTIVMMRLGGKTNTSYANILLGNIEIIKIFRKNNLKLNITLFLLKKILNRSNQYLKAKMLKK